MIHDIIENVALIVYIGFLAYAGVVCYHIQQAVKKADRLIDEMRREIERNNGDGA